MYACNVNITSQNNIMLLNCLCSCFSGTGDSAMLGGKITGEE